MKHQEIMLKIVEYGVVFSIGFVAGWVAHNVIKHKDENWERSTFSIVVLLVWAISVLVDIILTQYETPYAVHAVMGLVAGFFFKGNFKDAFGISDKPKKK